MEFRIQPLLLRLWNFGKKKTTQTVTNKYVNPAVSHIGRIPSFIFQKNSCRSSSAFDCMNHLQYYGKDLLIRNLFLKFLMIKKDTKEASEEEWGGPEAFKLITFIKDNFDDVLEKNSSVMVFFSANWCPHCLRLRKPYGMAALMSKEAKLPITFATFDVNHNPDVADQKGVVGIPLIKYYKDRKFVTNYKGKRTAEELFQFAKNPEDTGKDDKNSDI